MRWSIDNEREGNGMVIKDISERVRRYERGRFNRKRALREAAERFGMHSFASYLTREVIECKMGDIRRKK